MDFTMQQLRMLREVASRKTIAAAADSLGYTPSAVSQQLAGLERSTGVAVLERVGRNVRLTDAGRELVRHAGDLLAGMEAARVALEQVNSEVRGELDVAIYESVAATLLPPLLARLGERFPDLRLRTRQVDPDLAIDSLALGDIDLAFAIDYPHAPAAPRSDVVRHSVLDDHFHVVVSRDDPIRRPVVSLAELADRPFISSPAGLSCGRCVVTACHSAGFEPDIVHQLDDYPTTLHLVAAGQGVALVPVLGLARLPSGVRVIDLDPPLCRTIQLAYRKTSAERPSIAAVRMTLQEVVADLPGLTPYGDTVQLV
jgi:DNA-binding transcriptional LysR family regulator